MTYGFPSPVGRHWMGSYIDDILSLLILEVDADGSPLSSDDLEPVRRLRAAHAAAGTQLHTKKRQERVSQAVIWGARAARVRGEAQVAHQLIKVTISAVLEGRLSPHMVTCLTSSWTHHMMFARSSLCLFQEAAQAQTSGAARDGCG